MKNTDKLNLYIKKIVKEEIATQLKSCLVEMLTGVSSEKNQSTEYITETNSIVPPVKKEYKTYTKNKLLNDILNQTTGGVPNEGEMVGLTESMQTHKSTGFEIPDSAPEAVKNINNIINRDYRSLLKAVDKKKSQK